MPTGKGIAEQLITLLKATPEKAATTGNRLTVHATVSRFSFLYERIRNAVDYKDEHLLRKAAIERILMRQFLLERDAHVIALNLLREMVGARYLPNGTVPEQVVLDVAMILRKYLSIQRVNVGGERHLRWLRGVISSEIEDRVVNAAQEKGLVTFLYERLAGRVRVEGVAISEADLRLQVYLASYRMLLKADPSLLSYKLLRAYLPEWLRPADWIETPQVMAERLVGVELRIRQSLNHPLSQRFQKVVKPWAVALQLLRMVIQEKPMEASATLLTPATLDAEIARHADKQYKLARGKLRRGAVRAMIYLFATKMIVAFLIEVPVEYYLYHEIQRLSLGINLLFPPVLMFIVSLFIHAPGKKNTERVKKHVAELLSEGGVDMQEIRINPQRQGTSRFVFSSVYAAMFLVIFGAIGFMLYALHFTWVSAAIFLFFLCVVSFFAFRLRIAAREWVVVEEREGTFSVLMDVISLPILRAGQWLSRSISRLNVFLFFFDFLFEAPFKIFLSILEEWFAFMKEKREELQ
jgi:hypothetical protein